MKYNNFAEVAKVHDGDTTRFNIHTWIDQLATERCRFAKCFCPELKNPDGTDNEEGLAAKAFVQRFLKIGKEVRLETTVRDNYGRPLVDVFLPRKGKEDLYFNQFIIDNGHGKPVALEMQVLFPDKHILQTKIMKL
jgi:endonuclease YncB( thermonuclease family)